MRADRCLFGVLFREVPAAALRATAPEAMLSYISSLIRWEHLSKLQHHKRGNLAQNAGRAKGEWTDATATECGNRLHRL